jgi:eukaryotic-like serine/threonine-protein kinase
VPSVLLAGRYRAERFIGSGALSEVWQSTDLTLARTVVVKQLLPELDSEADALACFRNLARRTGSVSHPGVARIYDYDEPEPPGRAFMVMEFVDGCCLTSLLQRRPLPPARAMDVVAQVADAVHATHLSSLSGLGLAPRSILVGRDGRVKLTSLGQPDPARPASAAADIACDLRALGQVAYYCLVGLTGAVRARSPRDQRLPPFPPGIPAQAAELTWRLLAADPDQPPDSHEVARAAASIAHPAPPGCGPAAWPADTITVRTDLPPVAVIDAAPTSQPRSARSHRGDLMSSVFPPYLRSQSRRPSC